MNNILEKNNRRRGMTVPEGYFEDFAARMASSLPEQPWETAAAVPTPRRTFWQTVKPYVYMAAMFAGIWCMMKVFDHVRPSANDLSVDNNPVLTAALNDKDFVNEYFIDDMDEGDVYDVVWNGRNE